MKNNNNDTWLAFFKRTLKVSGYIILGLFVLVGALIGWVIYNQSNLNGDTVTYLNCEERYVAFTDYKIRSNWDGLEEAWGVDLKVTKINKSKVEAKFNFNDGEGIYIIDRIKGTIELKNLTTNETLVKRKCSKIKKKDLPKSKVTPKF